MGVSDLYESDFVLWTEQQAQALRQVSGANNSLDVSHLAEEIEDLGKRDVREVESLMLRIMEHLLKAAHRPSSPAARHWRAEIITFQDEARRAFTNSMRQKIDIDRLWQTALTSFAERAGLSRADRAGPASGFVFAPSPIEIDRLVSDRFDLETALSDVRLRLAPKS